MIPSDLAARLRMLTEASFFDSEPPVQGTAKVREIQARLPQLLPGQQFTATLQRPLPDGTFQAIVGGRSYTLALNHAAKAGDTLELVVTKNTSRAVFASLADNTSATGTAAADASRPNLSPTGRLISFLLTGQPAAAATQLAAGKPLLSSAPTGSQAAQTLAPALREALSQSGLFYEAHQQRWLAGRYDTAGLLREPQGQLSPLLQPGAAAAGAGGTTSGLSGTLAGLLLGVTVPGATTREGGADAQQRGVPGQASAEAAGRGTQALRLADGEAARAAEAQQASGRAPTLPERLLPVVHQQLDAMATQQYIVHGQAWPGQRFEWEIDDPERDHGEGDEAADGWHTTLRVSLPRLGGVEARLHLTPAGIALRLLADDDASVQALIDARPALDAALQAADLPLTGFVAERRHAAE
ncbi:MAG: flagellar hook-length control protein FliK [Rhodocyclaceae bacterium]